MWRVGPWLVDKSLAKNTGQACLTLWYPARVMLAYRFFVVSEQVGDVEKGIECPERLAMAASAHAARCSGVSPRAANLPSGVPVHQNYFGAAVFASSWASTLCAVSSDRFARASQLAASTKGCGSPGLRAASSLARS